jgi:transposase InsO family protein
MNSRRLITSPRSGQGIVAGQPGALEVAGFECGNVSSSVLDDFSRYIVAWRLGPTMCASDVTATLDLALAAAGLDRAIVMHRPRLLSDNGSSYVASDLAAWLEDKKRSIFRTTLKKA